MGGAQATAAGESYRPTIDGSDQVITAASIEAALASVDCRGVEAIVIRTSANEREYSFVTGGETPYLTNQAVQSINATGCRHLLIDLPSIDRLDDGGLLTNHRLFWIVADGSVELSADSRPDKTITEMITVPTELADNLYLLNLQTTSMITDASPSRPVLFAVDKK